MNDCASSEVNRAVILHMQTSGGMEICDDEVMLNLRRDSKFGFVFIWCRESQLRIGLTREATT